MYAKEALCASNTARMDSIERFTLNAGQTVHRTDHSIMRLSQ